MSAPKPSTPTPPPPAPAAVPEARVVPTPTASPNATLTPPPTPAETAAATTEEDAKIKEARSKYRRAKVWQIFGRLRRHVSFFILCGLFLFANLWVFATAWQQEKAGENENWFHEGLFFMFSVLALLVFYYRLYRKSEVYQTSIAKREAAERAAHEAKMQLEEEQKRQAFTGLIKDFQAAQTYEQKSSTMAKLLTVGLESTLLRQQAIDLLCDLNAWMPEYQVFLSHQNLIIWRLKSSLFEQSERFTIDTSTQDLSIKSINIIEAIVKKHLVDFKDGRSKESIDLSGRAIPTLTLTAQDIPAGSLKLDKAVLWQASFSETHLKDLSFAGSDLQGASFWRAQMENVNLLETNLEGAKLRTNLESVLNLTPQQFFSSKEWELCYLSEEQIKVIFADPERLPPGAKEAWDGAEPRRRKLYFKLMNRGNAIQEI